MGLDLEPWEPEETVGKIWHVWASSFGAPQDFEDQAVALTEDCPLTVAVCFAAKAASVSVTRMGAQASAPYRDEIAKGI